MGNNNKGKVIQMLSPDNYIRQKARKLPVYECLINSNWDESKMAQIVVAREHSNGNITAGVFLVDMFCLGVKDSFSIFNIPKFRYIEEKETIFEHSEFINVDYSLVHNVVFAAVEFAEEFGFKPYKDFTSVSKYILEEDSDDVELIEIECGLHGKPAYFKGPFDDEVKVNRIISQLEKSAGPGNYTYVDNPDDWEADDNDFFDDSEDEIDEFFDLLGDAEKLDNEGIDRLNNLTEQFFDEMVEPDLVDQHYKKISEILKIEILRNDIPDEMLGQDIVDQSNISEIKKMFNDLLMLSIQNKIKAMRGWENFREKAGDIPATYYLQLMIFMKEDSPEYMEKLNELVLLFPDYPSFRLLLLIKSMSFGTNPTTDYNDLQLNFSEFFGKRKSLHILELLNYLIFNIFSFVYLIDPSKLKAFESVVSEIELNDNEFEVIFSGLQIAKMACVREQLDL
jgi:hypothetical protein